MGRSEGQGQGLGLGQGRGRGQAQGQAQAQGYCMKYWCDDLGREGREKGERRERGTGTDERDWDRDIA